MPIKLTSSDAQVILVVAAVSAASLAVGARYFWRAFPEAAIEFRLDREDSRIPAEKFLAQRAARIEGYKHAVIFNFSDNTKTYLERTQGLEKMDALTRGPVRLWRWSHRWFKPQQQEEFRVDVTPTGDVVGFEHEVPEAAPGASLDAASARSLAETFLRDAMKRDLAVLEFVEAETERRPARTDHSFTWKQRSVGLGEGSLRVNVDVSGDQISAYREYVKIPEQWTRDYQTLRSRNESAQVVAEIFLILLTIAMGVTLVRRLRDRDVPMRLSLGFGLVAAALYFLGQLNTFSLEEFSYRTTDSYSSFLADYLRDSALEAFGIGAWIALLVAASEPVYRQGYPGLTSIRRTLSWQGLRSRSFFMANVVGIGLTFFFFAYQTVFYLAANKLGAWAPADIPFSNLLNTRVPWVFVLFIGFLPAVSEEMQFRAFAIPFLKKYFRSGAVAVVFAAFNWGFLHAAYPNQPFYIRGVEVGIAGIITGLVMLRFGIFATLIWHYSVDALYTAFLLLRSPNHYLMVSGGITAGIMLVPFLVALIAYWRAGTFADETALTNAREGITRAPRQEAVATAEAPLAYQPLDRRRLLWAGALTVFVAALALIPARRFGEGTRVQTTRPEAIARAEEYLRQRQVAVERFRRVAWIEDNVDGVALKYLLERRSVEEADRIYRQATRLVLWQVRFFRELEKEEHLVFVDAAEGRVFSYRHLLDEGAPGAALSPEQARPLAEDYLARQGFNLEDFDIQDSQVEKRKARTDHTLVWQAKAGDPRNVGEAHYRLQVEIAGDEVVSFSRFFKVPDEWVRARTGVRMPNVLLGGVRTLVIFGLVGGALVLLVRRLRAGEIRWKPAAGVGAALVVLMALGEVNQLPLLYRAYDTSKPLNTFWLSASAGLLIVPLGVGIGVWVLVGLAASLYPEAWRLFDNSSRRAWRRDAAVAVVVSVAASFALDRLGALVAERFHAIAPVGTALDFNLFDSFSPGAGFFLRSLLSGVSGAGVVAVVIYLVRFGVTRRAWWVWPGGLLLLVGLGGTHARSMPEYLVEWVIGLAALVVNVGIVWVFLRNNVLAYLAALFCLSAVPPIVSLARHPGHFFFGNAWLLGFLTAGVLLWWWLPRGRAQPDAKD